MVTKQFDLPRVARKAGKFCLFVLAVLTCAFLIRLRIPYEGLDGSEKSRITEMSCFMFFLSVPAFVAVFRILFGRYMGMLLSALYTIICLVPYKYFFPPDADLFHLYFLPSPQTVFGFSATWILLGYFLLAFAFGSFYWRVKKHRWFPAVRWNEAATILSLLALCLIQVLARMDTRSPVCVACGYYRGVQQPRDKWTIRKMRAIMPMPAGQDREPTGYFGGHILAESDLLHHHIPAAMFRGNRTELKLVNKGVNNRRPLAPYIYSNLSMFFDPYHTSIVVNALFYLLIVIGGYRLAQTLNLPEVVAVSFGVLLSCNCLLIYLTMLWLFYIQSHAFTMLILLLAFKLRIMDILKGWPRQLVFCCVLGCMSLTYDPFVLSATILLWAGVNTVLKLGTGQYMQAAKRATHGLTLAVVPAVSQRIWENLLKHYEMLGFYDNYQCRNDILDRALLLPAWAAGRLPQFLELLNKNLMKLVLNPINDCTYWSTLELLGLICLFALFCRYAHRRFWVGGFSWYFGNLLSTLIASLIAAIPPLIRHHTEFLKTFRSYNAYPVLVLSQALGIHFLSKLACRALKVPFLADVLTIGFALIVYFMSFKKLLFM